MRGLVKPPAIVAIVVLGLTIAACDDENVTVQAPTATNEEPGIVWVHPEYDGDSVVVVSNSLPAFNALVVDRQGLADIFAVFMNIGSIKLNGMTAREDTTGLPPEYCDGPRPSYAVKDVIDLSSLVPKGYPGLKDIRMRSDEGGIFYSPNFGPQGCSYPECPALLDLMNASPLFHRDSYCSDYFDGFFRFRLDPPLVPTSVHVFVTRVDLTLKNMTITVYDGAGHRVTKALPDLRAVFETGNEHSLH